jgi:hypothetical protein
MYTRSNNSGAFARSLYRERFSVRECPLLILLNSLLFNYFENVRFTDELYVCRI